jgi:hypothetical protein
MPRFRCPHCQSVLDVHASYAGKFIACEKCGKGINIPAAAPKPAAGSAPAAPRPAAAKDDVQAATAAATSAAALAHGLPGAGTVTGEPDRLQDMPCDPLPGDAGSAVADLGEPICSIKTAGLAWAYYVAAATAGLGLFALGYAVIAFAAGIGPVSGRVAPLVLGLAFLALGVLTAVAAWIEARRTLWLCPNGLLWQVRGKTGHCRWDGVKRLNVLIAHVITTGARQSRRLVYKYVLNTESGFRMQLHSDELYGTKTVGEFIQDRATRALLPVYRRRLQDGEPLDFDAVRADDEGVFVRGTRLPWAGLGRVAADQGNLVLGKGGDRGPVLVPLEQVAHVLVFLQLAAERSAKSGRAR